MDTEVEGLTHGGYVTVWIETNRKEDALITPMDSLVVREGVSYVFVVDQASGVVEQRRVKTGITGETGVEVLSGLSEDERVVAMGRYRLTSGMYVRMAAVEESMP